MKNMATTVVARKRQRTMQLVERLMVHPKARQYVHPAYRQLILRKQRSSRRAKRKIPTVRKLIDRAIHRSQFPLVRPFFCETCGMASSELETLIGHTCGKKIGNLSDNNNNWKRIINNGVRSKAKDALAVLENITYPQEARIKKTIVPRHEDIIDTVSKSDLLYQPKTLADIAFAAVDSGLLSNCEVQTIPVTQPRRQTPRRLCAASDTAVSPKRLGYYCIGCRQIFQPYYAYDEHLIEGTACVTLMQQPIEVDINSTFPLNGNHIAPVTFPISKDFMECTACHRNNFDTREDFHAHIFECSRTLDTETEPSDKTDDSEPSDGSSQRVTPTL